MLSSEFDTCWWPSLTLSSYVPLQINLLHQLNASQGEVASREDTIKQQDQKYAQEKVRHGMAWLMPLFSYFTYYYCCSTTSTGILSLLLSNGTLLQAVLTADLTTWKGEVNSAQTQLDKLRSSCQLQRVSDLHTRMLFHKNIFPGHMNCALPLHYPTAACSAVLAIYYPFA